MNLTSNETRLLDACCRQPNGKGVPVGKEWRKVASSLTRKSLAYTIESVFMVCIATPAGRAALEQLKEK